MKAKGFVVMLMVMLALQVQAGKASYYFWQGKVGGLPVKLACAVKDGVMTGEMFSEVDGSTEVYNVAGYETDGMYDIRVYDDGEGINYIYFLRAELKGSSLVGIVQPSGEKFRLRKYSDKYASPIDREPGVYSSPYLEGKVFRFEGWGRGGMYQYENPMRVKGELTLWGNTRDETFELSIRRDGGPDNKGNDALVDAAGLYLPDHGDFDYTIQYCGYTFSVRFYDHFLVIRSVSGSPSGCFGSGAAITGIYIAVPAKG